MKTINRERREKTQKPKQKSNQSGFFAVFRVFRGYKNKPLNSPLYEAKPSGLTKHKVKTRDWSKMKTLAPGESREWLPPPTATDRSPPHPPPAP
jgi:hypothetical protein